MKILKRILNLGCGEDLSYGTHFVDLYPVNKKVIKVDLCKDRFPFPDNYFDEVYANWILEHIANPAHLLKESHRVLKKHGRIMIVTDNAGFWGIFSEVHQGLYEKINNDRRPDDRHYHIFTPQHLRNWLELFGFKSIKVSYMMTENIVLWQKIIAVLFSLINYKLYPSLKATAWK
jgi:SAM-dependent methyltransferase